MSRYGLMGRALRSPLNPIWSLSQAPRMMGSAMAAATPAAAALGDQWVDQQSPAITQFAGKMMDQMGGSGTGLKDMVTSAAPMMAKLAGRAGWGMAAGAMGGLGDIGSGENPSRSMAEVARGQLMAVPRMGGDGPRMPQVGAGADGLDGGEMGPPLPPGWTPGTPREKPNFMGGSIADYGAPKMPRFADTFMGDPPMDGLGYHPAIPQRRRPSARPPHIKAPDDVPMGQSPEMQSFMPAGWPAAHDPVLPALRRPGRGY